MKFQKLKSVVQLTAMIFTGIVILEAAAGQSFRSAMIWEILVCAVVAALIKFCFFSENIFESSPFIQSVYLILVWLAALLCNDLFGWGMTWYMALVILTAVLIIYFVIRLLNYQLIKMEVKRMNQRLAKSEKGKGKKTSV